jgi:hypothetical protein
MIRIVPILVGGALIACSQEAPSEKTRAEPAKAAAAAPKTNACTAPALASTDKAVAESSAVFRETKANFSAAFASACAKGLLKDQALIDPEAPDQARLFLLNAPESNVASIYLPRKGSKGMVLEYYFVTPDGQTHVPPADELEEAIYCSVHGATPQEEEESGRCLPD